ATGPIDACKTPSPGGPVPLPYPNIADVSSAKGDTCTQKVKFLNKKVCTTKTEISRSSGDEPGTVGGIMSNKNMGEATYKMGSSKVIVEGEKCAHLTS